jgi:C-methyltransferase
MIMDVLNLWEFVHHENNRYKLKYSGKLLTENHSKSLKYASLMWGSEHYLVMSRLYQSLKTGKPQFEVMFGEPIFQYFNKNRKRGKIAFEALSEYTSDYDELLSLYNFPNSKIILDVGAGSGILLMGILEKYDQIQKGIILDLPYAIEFAQDYIRSSSLHNKIDFYTGNFFDPIPLKVDTIILSRIIHDLDDLKAKKLLKNLRNCLSDGGELVLFETIVPKNNSKNIGITLDFNLLVTLGGRERSLEDFEELLHDTGFKIRNIKSQKSLISILITKPKE